MNGYAGCWTCGKICACAETKPVIVTHGGRELSTPGWECQACFDHITIAAPAVFAPIIRSIIAETSCTKCGLNGACLCSIEALSMGSF